MSSPPRSRIRGGRSSPDYVSLAGEIPKGPKTGRAQGHPAGDPRSPLGPEACGAGPVLGEHVTEATRLTQRCLPHPGGVGGLCGEGRSPLGIRLSRGTGTQRAETLRPKCGDLSGDRSLDP